MGERDDARGTIEESRDHLSEIVEELARRATPGYVGGQIKEATVNKTRELKERAGSSPAMLAMLGGVIGASLGAYLAKSRSKGADVSYLDMEEEEEEESELHGVAERAKDKFRNAGERSSAALEDVRDRASEMKDRARSGLSRAWDEQPLLVSAGLVVIGALAALLAPVPEREKQLVEPARRKAHEGVQKLGEKIESVIAGEDTHEETGEEEAGRPGGEQRPREIPIEGPDTGYPPVVH